MCSVLSFFFGGLVSCSVCRVLLSCLLFRQGELSWVQLWRHLPSIPSLQSVIAVAFVWTANLHLDPYPSEPDFMHGARQIDVFFTEQNLQTTLLCNTC
jgi:hypothetical protein